MLEFTGTGYLGLQRDPRWLALVQANLERFGSNHPISRLNDHRDFDILHRLESHLAKSAGAESACLLSSGYFAGMAISRYFTHRAFREGMTLVFPANHHPCLTPPIGWRQQTITWDQSPKALASSQPAVVFGQTVDLFDGEMDGSMHSSMMTAAAWRVIDCSHTKGLWRHDKLNPDPSRTVFVGSIGKASAYPAGFIAGPEGIIEEIKTGGEYCAAAPPSLAFANAYLENQSLRSQLRQQLWRHLHAVDEVLNCHRQCPFPVYRLGPVRQGLKERLEQDGIRLSWLRYPNPTSPLHLRIVIRATHKDEDIRKLIAALAKHELHFDPSPNKPDHWSAYSHG